MKRFFSTVIGCFVLVTSLVLITTSHINAQQVIGRISPDSVWIPCGSTQTVNLMFSSTNGVSVSNFSDTSQLIPYLRNGLVAWYPFYGLNGANTQILKDRSMNGNDLITASGPISPSFLGYNPFPNFPTFSDDRFITSTTKSYWLHPSGGANPLLYFIRRKFNNTITSNKLTLSFWYKFFKNSNYTKGWVNFRRNTWVTLKWNGWINIPRNLQ